MFRNDLKIAFLNLSRLFLGVLGLSVEDAQRSRQLSILCLCTILLKRGVTVMRIYFVELTLFVDHFLRLILTEDELMLFMFHLANRRMLACNMLVGLAYV